MMNVKSIAGGLAIAGSLGIAALGFGSGTASAAPAPVPPQVASAQDAGESGPSPQPSPYAIYGGTDLCGMQGMFFSNVCT